MHCRRSRGADADRVRAFQVPRRSLRRRSRCPGTPFHLQHARRPSASRRRRAGPRDRSRELYAQEEERVLALFAEAKENRSGGGNFYNVQSQRLSRQFARAVVASAREGGTSYRDAYKLLGTKKHSTFEALAERVGTR